MANKVSQIRGNVIASRLAYLRETGGEDLVAQVLKRLAPDEQAQLKGMILSVSWFPLSLAVHLDEAISATLSPDMPSQALINLGRASADASLSGPQAVFVKPGDPHHLLGHAPQIYRMYYSVGHRTYEKTGDRSGVLKTFESESGTPGDCLTIVGWYQRAIELCGGREVKVKETRCRALGEDHCEYHCSWELRREFQPQTPPPTPAAGRR